MNKICHVVQSYYPRDPRIRRQAEALAANGFLIDVYCLRATGERAKEVVNGVHINRLPLCRKRGSGLRYTFEYLAFFMMVFIALTMKCWKRYDVIHVSNLPDFLVYSALVPKLLGTKVLLDEHDPMPELFMSKYGVDEGSRVIRFLKRQQACSLRFADHVLTVNAAMRKLIEPSASPVPVSVVMNLPDDKLFKPIEKLQNTNHDGQFSMLYTGTVSKTYGLSMVVDAVANLKDNIPGLRLRIVGEGDDLPALRRQANELGISDRVDFSGVVPFDHIPTLISESDIGISTLKLDTLTQLCFNNKTAEYTAMGLPSVVTRTLPVESHFPEGIVRFYEPGSQESFEQAIVDLYENPEIRAEMSRKGIEFSKTANWSTEKIKYIELITRLCGNSFEKSDCCSKV